MTILAIIGAVLNITGAALVAYAPEMARAQRTNWAGRDMLDCAIYWANCLWAFGNACWLAYAAATGQWWLGIQAVVFMALAVRGVFAWR